MFDFPTHSLNLGVGAVDIVFTMQDGSQKRCFMYGSTSAQAGVEAQARAAKAVFAPLDKGQAVHFPLNREKPPKTLIMKIARVDKNKAKSHVTAVEIDFSIVN